MKKLKDGTTSPFEKGDFVIYIPAHLLSGHKRGMIEKKHLGIVSSKNEIYVFVKYDGNETAQATNPDDLYFLNNRPDLVESIKAKINGNLPNQK